MLLGTKHSPPMFQYFHVELDWNKALPRFMKPLGGNIGGRT